MTDLFRTTSRLLRALAVTAAITLTAGAGPAWASDTAGTTAPGGTESALQIQAQELTAQIQADGRTLDQMAEAFNAAQLRNTELATRLANLKADMSRTDSAAAAARNNLREQAVISYVVGGAPTVSRVPDSAGLDRTLALSYAEIVTGSQKRAVDNYRQLLNIQSEQSAAIAGEQHDAEVNLAQMETDRAAAAQADSTRKQALSRVTGQLATLVAQVQARQQAAAKAAAERRAAEQAAAATRPAALTNSAPRPAPAPAPAPQPPSRATVTQPAARPAAVTSQPARGSTPTTAPPAPQQNGGSYAQAPGADKAIAYARAQLGKPYQWAGAGPDTFDCSGLTMRAWEQAGVYFPHLAQDQYNMTKPVTVLEAIPGDLIFFGSPSNVYHVGIYIGNGEMIDAPQTGENVSIQSIYWTDLLGAGRVTA